MRDIFDNIKVTAAFNQDELIDKLFHRCLAQQAEINALSIIVCDLLQEVKGLGQEQAIKVLAGTVDSSTREVFMNDPLMIEAIDKKNREQLGLDDGFKSNPD